MKKILTVLLALAVLCMFTSCLSGGEDVGPVEGRGVPSLGLGGGSNDDAEEVHGEAESTGLTDPDMKAIIKNYEAIMDALDEYGADYTADDYDSLDDDLEDILASFGISGPGRYNKLIMAHWCEGYLDYQAELKKDFKTAMVMKAAGIDPLADYRRMLNDDDLKVVKANYKAFKKAVDNY